MTATWTCAAVAIACLVGARTVPEIDDLNRAAPLVALGLLWGLAAYRLGHGGRGGLAHGLAVFSIVVVPVSAVVAWLWSASWAGGGTWQLTPAAAAQLIIPFVGAVVVLLALRPRRRSE
ncbi:MAG: hypothetical protein ABJA16_09835 [Nakamurella sp.]